MMKMSIALSALIALTSIAPISFASDQYNDPPLKYIFLPGMMLDVVTTSGIHYDYKSTSISSSNPSPLTFNLKSESLVKTPFSACSVFASAYPDIATERYVVRAESMTCTRKVDDTSFVEPIHAFFSDKRDDFQGLKCDQNDHELNLSPGIEASILFM
ncbi:MAG: hypothetical protein K0U21_06260 [Proteobacteria bacterium]|nr:hypothetical protein [Pseudomonadota bacterium]